MLFKTLITFAISLTATQAATIRNWSNRNCLGNSRVCTNIAPFRCCAHAGRVYMSSSFHYLNPVSISVVCTGTANQPCKTSKATKYGGGCLQHGSGTTRLRGSYVFDCIAAQRVCPRTLETVDRTVAALGAEQQVQSVLPDKLVLDGKVFNINGMVSQADTVALEALADADAKYVDVPAHLLLHEVKGEAAGAILKAE